MITEEDNVLYARMFGSFSVRWNGNVLAGAPGEGRTPFASLMQAVLHCRQTGISRSRLTELLFGRDAGGAGEALNSVLRDAGRRLRECGLPELEYFVWHGDMLYWTPQVAVLEDAEEFERLCGEAERVRDKAERLECLWKACGLYRGKFMEDQAGVLWAESEARRYQEIFCACVEKAADMLRETEDYERLEQLGMLAAGAEPLEGWETVVMEALTALGRTEAARKFYDRTADYYYREAGLRPPKPMQDMAESMGDQVSGGYAALEQIQSGLAERPEEVTGGLACPYPVFRWIYRMVGRMMERGGQSVYLMLCSLADPRGDLLKDETTAEELSSRLLEAVCASVRHGDAVSCCGKGQCIVLLINTTREDCEKIRRRISRRFAAAGRQIGLEYCVSSVTCPADNN